MNINFPSSRRGRVPIVADTEKIQSAHFYLPSVRLDKVDIFMRGPVNTYTGYGQILIALATNFMRLGYGVRIQSTSGNELDERWGALIPDHIKAAMLPFDPDFPRDWTLQVSPLGTLVEDKNTVLFTMHESSGLRRDQVANLKRARHVIVPCAWNKAVFHEQSGINAQVVSLGIDTTLFRPYPPVRFAEGRSCVFGVAGRFVAAGRRKNIDFILRAFQEAFATNEDVKMIVKCHPDCPVPSEVGDSRIEFVRCHLSDDQFVNFLASCTALFLPSSGEAWNLIAHQASAIGRPCILPLYGGHLDYLSPSICLPLAFKTCKVPREESYYRGTMIQCDLESARQQLRFVRENREQITATGRLAACSVQRSTLGMTWDLLGCLRSFGFL